MFIGHIVPNNTFKDLFYEIKVILKNDMVLTGLDKNLLSYTGDKLKYEHNEMYLLDYLKIKIKQMIFLNKKAIDKNAYSQKLTIIQKNLHHLRKTSKGLAYPYSIILFVKYMNIYNKIYAMCDEYDTRIKKYNVGSVYNILNIEDKHIENRSYEIITTELFAYLEEDTISCHKLSYKRNPKGRKEIELWLKQGIRPLKKIECIKKLINVLLIFESFDMPKYFYGSFYCAERFNNCLFL